MTLPVRRPFSRATASATVGLILLLGPRIAGADAVAPPAPTLRLPIAFVNRPLTTPQYVFALSLDASYAQEPDVTAVPVYAPTPQGNEAVTFRAVTSTLRTVVASPGVSLGITDDVELHTRPLPVVYQPDSTSFFLDGIRIGATYRFVRGSVVEVGVGGDFIVTTHDLAGVGLTAGLPVRLHLGHAVRIDTGPVLTFEDLDGPTLSWWIPLRLAVQLAPTVFAGASTGLQTQATDLNGGETVSPSQALAFPLGFFAGVTVPGREGPLLEVRPYFTWNELLTPSSSPATHGDAFVAGLVATDFLYF